jgi:hypothetical protein
MKTALGEMAVMVLEGQRAVPAKLQALNFEFKYDTVGAALRNLLGKTEAPSANGQGNTEQKVNDAPPAKARA